MSLKIAIVYRCVRDRICGAFLRQRQKDEYKPTAFASINFSPTQRRYSIFERELVAIR